MSDQHSSPPLTIAVAGGTGTVGQHVVDVARRRGHEVVVLSRRRGTDLVAGTGLDDALRGVDVVIDATSQATQDSGESRAFFGAVTRPLTGRRGPDGRRAPPGAVHRRRRPRRTPATTRANALQEELLGRSGPVPSSVLRATQFHEFVPRYLLSSSAGGPRHRLSEHAGVKAGGGWSRLPALVALAEAGPSGRVADLGGPRRERMVDMVRGWARATGRPARVVAVPVPGALGRVMRNGGLVTGAGADSGTQTYAEWLAALR